MNKTKHCLLILILLFAPLVLFAQNTVTGIVSDELGEPIIGATVIEKKTANGAATDHDGKFTLNVNPGAIIEPKLSGYQSRLGISFRKMFF